jgi:hypothetical protein
MDDFLTLTQAEFDELKALQRTKRWDWPAVFSVSPRDGEIWPYVRRGYTPEQEREPVSGLSRVIDEVAKRYLKLRSDGGRFFIHDKLAFYKGPAVGDPRHLIVIFKITD